MSLTEVCVSISFWPKTLIVPVGGEGGGGGCAGGDGYREVGPH